MQHVPINHSSFFKLINWNSISIQRGISPIHRHPPIFFQLDERKILEQKKLLRSRYIFFKKYIYINEWCRDTVLPLKFVRPSLFHLPSPSPSPFSRFLLFPFPFPVRRFSSPFHHPLPLYFIPSSRPVSTTIPPRRWKNICRRGNAVSNPAEFHEYSRSNKCCEFKWWRFAPPSLLPFVVVARVHFVRNENGWTQSATVHSRLFAFSFHFDFGNIRRAIRID